MTTPQQCAFMVFSVSVALLLSAGCASRGKLPIVPFEGNHVPPRSIAVLPLNNLTNSVPGALHMRQLAHDRLTRRGYEPKPLDEVDHELADRFGISLGGQIMEEMISEIGSELGVDALLYGTLQRFGTVLTLYSEVEATFVMYDTATGDRIWDYHDHVKKDLPVNNADSNSISVGAALAVTAVQSLMERGSGKPLNSVAEQYYNGMTRRMPSGAGAYGDPDTTHRAEPPAAANESDSGRANTVQDGVESAETGTHVQTK